MAAWDSCFAEGIPGAEDVATLSCLAPLFENVVKAVIAFAGIGLFLMLLSSGFSFLFSAGDPKKLEQARGTMTQAIMGLVVMSAAYVVVNMIGTFTGIDSITTFSVPGVITQ